MSTLYSPTDYASIHKKTHCDYTYVKCFGCENVTYFGTFLKLNGKMSISEYLESFMRKNQWINDSESVYFITKSVDPDKLKIDAHVKHKDEHDKKYTRLEAINVNSNLKENEYLKKKKDKFSEVDLDMKTDIALCFSGGGLYAFFFHIGILRALHKMGLLPFITYNAGVSGGDWTIAAYLSYLNPKHEDGFAEKTIENMRDFYAMKVSSFREESLKDKVKNIFTEVSRFIKERDVYEEFRLLVEEIISRDMALHEVNPPKLIGVPFPIFCAAEANQPKTQQCQGEESCSCKPEYSLVEFTPDCVYNEDLEESMLTAAFDEENGENGKPLKMSSLLVTFGSAFNITLKDMARFSGIHVLGEALKFVGVPEYYRFVDPKTYRFKEREIKLTDCGLATNIALNPVLRRGAKTIIISEARYIIKNETTNSIGPAIRSIKEKYRAELPEDFLQFDQKEEIGKTSFRIFSNDRYLIIYINTSNDDDRENVLISKYNAASVALTEEECKEIEERGFKNIEEHFEQMREVLCERYPGLERYVTPLNESMS